MLRDVGSRTEVKIQQEGNPSSVSERIHPMKSASTNPQALRRGTSHRYLSLRQMSRSMSSGTAVAALSVSAGLVHLLLAPAHLQSGWPQGAFFLIVGLLQIGLPGARGRKPALALLLLNASVLLIWTVSRTVGIPLIDTSGPAPIAPADLFVSLLELVTIVLLLKSARAPISPPAIFRRARNALCVSALCLMSFTVATPFGVACGHETTHSGAASRADQSEADPCGEAISRQLR